MANFTVRVELHGADSDDYEKLHEAMEAANFMTTIEGGGKVYKLPPAEYTYTSTAKPEEVRDKAAAVAKTIKKNPAVFVTKSDGRYWLGLKEA